MKIERLACIAASWLASPVAIVAVPVLTVAAVLVFGAEIPLLVISILALTFSQLVLMSTAVDTREIQAMLRELVKVTPKASNDVIKSDES